MKNKFFFLINGLLVVMCLGFIYDLGTRKGEVPEEVVFMEPHQVDPVQTPPPSGDHDCLKRSLTQPLFTPTPTPTPTPAPTPPPPDLASVVQGWEITSLERDKVEFMEGPRDTFTLTIGGPARETIDKNGRPISVHLLAVDCDKGEAWLGAGNEKIKKPF